MANATSWIEFGRWDPSQGDLVLQNQYKQTPIVFLMTPNRYSSEQEPRGKLFVRQVYLSRSGDWKVDFDYAVVRRTYGGRIGYTVDHNQNLGKSFDYIAVLPGTHQLGDLTVVATTIETDRAILQGDRDKKVKWNRVNFGSSIRNAVVISQIQTQNNYEEELEDREPSTAWLTTAQNNVTDRSVNVLLERSGAYWQSDSRELDEDEVIGILAVTGNQTYDDGTYLYRATNGISTANTLRTNYPVEEACGVAIGYSSSLHPIYGDIDPSSAPILVGSAQSRKGTDGGWLKRCLLQPSDIPRAPWEVSFFYDEFKNRGDNSREHTSEAVGYFMRAKKPAPITVDHCELFPGPAQTWQESSNNSGQFNYQPNNQVLLSGNAKISGFNRVLHQGRAHGELGFDRATFERDTKCYDRDGKLVTCSIDGRPAQKKALEWPANIPSNCQVHDVLHGIWLKPDHGPHESFDGQYFQGCHYFRYKGANSAFKTSMGLSYGDHVTFESGDFWFDEGVNITQGATVTILGDVTFHLNSPRNEGPHRYSALGGNVVTANTPDQLTVFGYYAGGCPVPTDPSNVHYNLKIDTRGEFSGRVYAEGPVEMSNNAHVVGSVTACQLNMFNNSRIEGNSKCFDAKTYVLKVHPQRSQGLLCERQRVDFYLFADAPLQGAEAEESIEVSVPAQAHWFAAAVGGSALAPGQNTLSIKAKVQDPLESGEDYLQRPPSLTLYLQSEVIQQAAISVKLADDSLINEALMPEYPVKGQYDFLPAVFELTPNPVKMVAGKPELVTVTARACATATRASQHIGYQGQKTLTLNTHYQYPSTGQKAITFADGSTRKQVNFVNDQAQIELRYLDAGVTQALVSDPYCYQTGQGQSCLPRATRALYRSKMGARTMPQVLSGTTTLHSRPYTLAICDQNGEEPKNSQGQLWGSGDAKGGPGFIAAGTPFSLSLKPVVWQSSDGTSTLDENNSAIRSVRTENFCQRPVTANYFSSSMPATNGIHWMGVLSPSNGDAGDFSAPAPKSNQPAGAYGYLSFSDLTWSEVGTIALRSFAYMDMSASNQQYLGMRINNGDRALGRFYPHHLGVNDSDLREGSGAFTYMMQPFALGYTVYAYNQQGGALKNYDNFSPALRATVGLASYGKDGSNASATPQWQTSRTYLMDGQPLGGYQLSDWRGTGDRGESELMLRNGLGQAQALGVYFDRKVIQASPRTTTPDGPFDSLMMAVYAKTKPDGVDFATQVMGMPGEDLKGSTQRYGRMVLDSVGGTYDAGQLTIPTRVEYWNGKYFTLNRDDQSSEVDGSNYCKAVLWSRGTGSSRSSLNGKGTVNSGASNVLYADANRTASDPLYREQVQFWLRLAQNPPAGINVARDCVGLIPSPQAWLRYNWRNEGDEDPFTLVTFGTYRGNDRVIYRGETDLIQSNP
ncbi:polymer-forming cytoskeletal protein [Vibrio stylophorae]|nr:polymer-forming cytoskeletal protein [Vibrio stylophorae]